MPLRTVTHDLLARYLPGVGDRVLDSRNLCVTYVRVPDHPGTDPRAAVLRPSAAWRLAPGQTLGAGRAPGTVTPLDVALPLVEDDGRADASVPRLAVRIGVDDGGWRVSNHASGAATVLISAPGSHDELSTRSPAYAVNRRRLTLTVRSRCVQGDVPVAVEHRLTLFAPWIPDDAPAAPELEGPDRPDGPADGGIDAVGVGGIDAVGVGGVGGVGGAGAQRTTDLARGLRWSWAQQRLLAAWAYPELIGLPPRSQPRERTTRLLLRQGLGGRDPNERILSRLRRKASDELGVPLTGEANTPAFLAYVVSRRGYLGEALAALHAEFDATLS